MSIKSRTILKSKFETGDVPTQDDFHDWLDSFLHITEDLVNDLTSGGTSKALSAQQGVVLKGYIDTLQGEIDDLNYLGVETEAINVLYDNVVSLLDAENVQDAIDELKGEIDDLWYFVSNIEAGGDVGPELNTWYVDSVNGNNTTGDGSPQKPFATLVKANTEAANGDVVHFRGTEYFTASTTTLKELVIIGTSPYDTFDGYSEIYFGQSGKSNSIQLVCPHLELRNIEVWFALTPLTPGSGLIIMRDCKISALLVPTAFDQVLRFYNCFNNASSTIVCSDNVLIENCNDWAISVSTSDDIIINGSSGDFDVTGAAADTTATFNNSFTKGDVNLSGASSILEINNTVIVGTKTANTVTTNNQ